MSTPSAPPVPTEADDRIGWDRRFSWLVSDELARDRRLSPAGAAVQARAAVRREFESSCPSVQAPAWMVGA